MDADYGNSIEPHKSPEQKYTVSLDAVRYDKLTGLVPVVVQSAETKAVLMLAYANREALKRTYGTGQAWFWSRSRQTYWHKGETSGNVLYVRDIRLDCDEDTVLFLVDAAGPACHTGQVSCFFRSMTFRDGLRGAQTQFAGDDTGITAEEALIIEGEEDGTVEAMNFHLSPSAEIAEETPALPRVKGFDLTALDTLRSLWETIAARHAERPEGSYTTFLFEQGVDKVAKKVGEEAVEVAIAAKNAMAEPDTGRGELAQESADLLYHLFVLWQQAGLDPNQVTDVLQSRVR